MAIPTSEHSTALSLNDTCVRYSNDSDAAYSRIEFFVKRPGGPAQVGSFQVGMVVALGLLTTADQVDAASTFAAIMYLLQLLGACVLALPGALLMAWARGPESAGIVSELPPDPAPDPGKGA